MKKLELTKIRYFNPGRLSDEEIEQSFVTRIPLFEYIFKKIILEKEGSIPQHHLIVGQRGMGKTSLLMRIAVELRKTLYNEKFIALTFPEEQYNIDRLSKFWLNCLDALADALDRENRLDLTQRLENDIKENASQQNRDAYPLFEKWIKEIGRRPVLLVDNLGLVFSKISLEEHHQLRAILISTNAPVLVGASSVSLEEVVDYGAPFYDAFQIQTLKKLSLDESIEVLRNLSQITGYNDFENQLHKNRGRLGAIYQLTGGTPRTVAMLFPLVREVFSEEIQTDLDALMDLITPLYKARFEELSDQLQLVLDAVALHWDPINLEQLRMATQLENNQLSPQLKRLVEIGWLQKLDAFKAKGAAYEISERFFNIWYLMRRSARRQKRELYCLSRFLELYYGKEVEKIAHNRLATKSISGDCVVFDLALAKTQKNKKRKRLPEEKSYQNLYNESEESENIMSDSSLPTEWINNQLITKQLILEKAFEQKDYHKCHKIILAQMAISPENALIHYNLGLVLKNLLRFEETRKSLENSIELAPDYAYPWLELGNLFLLIGEHKKSEEAYYQAIELKRNFSNAWNGLGYLFSQQGKYEEAKEAYIKAVSKDKKFSPSWNGLGNLYQNFFFNNVESEKSYLKALDLDPLESVIKLNLVSLYRDRMNRLSQAKELFNSIPFKDSPVDSHALNEALFAYCDQNAGIAKEWLEKGLLQIKDRLPTNTQDDWWRSGAVSVKLGFGSHFLAVMKEHGFDTILRPYYVAIQALMEPKPESFLISKAAEVREPARQIMNWMKRYNE